MCGIAGVISLLPKGLDSGMEARVRAMTEAMVHRGPDDHGVYTTDNREAIFGHRRLSIIEPTFAGHQPMLSESGCVLVFNGEIYNYQELRIKYALNVAMSDTAVLLALLEMHGERVLPDLRGFFTFAFWNASTKEVLIARDAIGKKPLYYTQSNGKLIFASELRALLRSGEVEFELSQQSLARYLSLYSVPQPDSIVKDVRTLASGSLLHVSASGVEPSQWYRLPRHSPVSIAYPEAVRETRRLLEKSVRYRMVSDVPVGAFLSAGIDSNAIVGLMSKIGDSPVSTFTVGFDSESNIESETVLARKSAVAYGTQHHEYAVSDANVRDLLPDFFWHMDSPTGDGLNSFLVAHATHTVDPSLKVVLSGVGGDELFLGYRKYRWLAQRASLLKMLWSLPVNARKRFARLMAGGSSVRLFTALKTVLDPANVRSLYTDKEIHRMTGYKPQALVADAPESDEILRLLRSDIEGYLPDMLLRDLDVMTMSQSLEARAPLLDKELLEFAWQLPIEMKSRGASKQLLIDAVSDILPAEIKSKPKTGFELPMAEWLRNGMLRPYLNLLRDGSQLVRDGHLLQSKVTKVYADFDNGKTHYLKPWSLIALEFWYRSLKNNVTYEDWRSGAGKAL